MAKKKETDSSWIESELERKQEELERLQKCPSHGEDSLTSVAAYDAVAMNPQKGLHRLSELSLTLEYMGLSNEFSSWEEEWKQKQHFTGYHASLSYCVKLTNLLLRFPLTSAMMQPFERLHQIIWNRYMSILTSTRCALSSQIQHTLKNTGFPKSSSGALCRFFLEGNCEVEGDLSLVRCFTLLVALQTIHEHYMVASSTAASRMYTPWQRLDVVTEFCRPIAIRVRYHFTSSSDDFYSQPTSHGTLSKRYDRIVQWLLSFMRESMTAPLELIRMYFDDIARVGWKEAIEIMSSSSSSDDVSIICQTQPPAHIFQYFLREMVLLVRHALQDPFHSTAILRHNTVNTALCTIMSDDVLFSTSMEQMLRFDEYILNESFKISFAESALLNSDDMVLFNVTLAPIPRLTGIITNYHDRFTRWVELEHDAAMCKLASVPLPVDQQDTPTSKLEMLSNKTFPVFVETLVSLLCSGHVKCKVAFSPLGEVDTQYSVLFERHPMAGYHLAEYLNKVQITLIFSYLDAIQTWAKQQVRRILNCVQKLLSPASSKLWSTTSVTPSSDEVPTLELLTRFVQDYCKMIGGTTCVALLLLSQSIYWENIEIRDNASFHFVNSKKTSASRILKQMSDSVYQVSKAMVEELASSITECMVVDDASVASYFMKIHYILEEEARSGDVNGSFPRPENKQAHASSTTGGAQIPSQYRSLSISPDLVDFLATLCDVVNCLNFAHVHSSEIVIAADMLKSSLANGLSLKLIEVILDVPEISSTQGAFQVSVDIKAIANLFSLPSRLQVTNKRYDGSFDRLIDIVKLMNLQYQPFVSLRSAFSDLADVQHESTADYAGVDIALENIMSDDRVMEHAQDMLQAKDLVCLDLRDALIVLYRRSF